MKKLAAVILSLAVLGAGAWLGMLTLLQKASLAAMDMIAEEGREHGVRVHRAEFGEASLVFPLGARWKALSIEAETDAGAAGPIRGDIRAKADRVVLEAGSVFTRSFLLTVEGVEIVVAERRDSSPGTSSLRTGLVGEKGRIGFRLHSLSPQGIRLQAETVLSEIGNLVKEGRTSLPASFSGKASFVIHGTQYEAAVAVVREGDGSVLVINGGDVMAMSREFDLEKPLTDAEVRLLSRHPMRAPRLLEIRTYARRESNTARGKDGKVPEDAYRHVLWSYLLAREYGEEFARQVTDAHEEGRTGNTAAERSMDLHNNSVGRNYAGTGVPEDRILALVMADPDIVRSPHESSGPP